MKYNDKICVICGNDFLPNSGYQTRCENCVGIKKVISTRVCLQCGVDFDIHNSLDKNRKFCSLDCAYEERTRHKEKECSVCGVLFKPKSENTICCSRKCGAKSAAGKMKRPDFICKVCGKSYNSRHRSKTCSYTCASELKKLPPVNYFCKTCGKEIPHSDYRNRKYCSLECRNNKPVLSTHEHSNGYLRIKVPKDYPFTHEKYWVLEHRYVMQNHLQRSLLPHENVHHINGIKGDNRLENLELWSSSQPKRQRHDDVNLQLYKDVCTKLMTPRFIVSLSVWQLEHIETVLQQTFDIGVL
jgi:hypothetical protein